MAKGSVRKKGKKWYGRFYICLLYTSPSEIVALNAEIAPSMVLPLVSSISPSQEIVKVGDTVQISYEGEIDDTSGNTLAGAISAFKATISDGDVLIPE